MKLYTSVADNFIKREYGLKNIKRLPQNHSMLFKFPNQYRLSFWMKDTYIPLDIAFIDEQGKITQIEEMNPLSTRAISSKHSCKYALEVNKGWFKQNNIKVGDNISGFGIDNQQQENIQNPVVTLEKTVKEKIEDANKRNQKMIIIYRTKEGKELPPKKISPPFNFEEDKEGKHDGIVKVWDEQDAGWKSFLVENIINIDVAHD